MKIINTTCYILFMLTLFTLAFLGGVAIIIGVFGHLGFFMK